MHPFRFDGKFLQQLVLIFPLFIFRKVRFFNFSQFRTDIRQDIELRIAGELCHQVDTLLANINGVVLFIDHKKEFVIDDMHMFCLLLEVKVLGFQHQRLHPRFTQEFYQRIGFRQAPIGPEKQFAAFFLICGRWVSGE